VSCGGGGGGGDGLSLSGRRGWAGDDDGGGGYGQEVRCVVTNFQNVPLYEIAYFNIMYVREKSDPVRNYDISRTV